MATIQFSAHHAQSSGNGRFSVIFHLTDKPDPMPAKVVQVKTTAEALALFEAYKAEGVLTGLPMACTMSVKDRAPNGFKAATANKYYHGVNV